MTREELLKELENMKKKCSELESQNDKLEKENADLKRSGEDKDLRIEHLTELLLKRNKMLFGKKSESGKNLYDGQYALDGSIFNEAEAESDMTKEEPSAENVVKKSAKTGKHRDRNEIRKDLETKKVTFDVPESQKVCSECGEKLSLMTEELLTTRIAVIPEKIYKIEYYRKVYKCKNCDKNGLKANIVKAENKTPKPVVNKGLADCSLISDIAQRKYQLGEPLYRQEEYWKQRGIYLNRTSMANWIIAASKWLAPVVERFWHHAFLEAVLNADETPIRVLKKDGKPTDKKGQMWVICSGAAASKKIAIYVYRDSRSKVVAEELLGDYTGIVQTDGLQSYGSGKYINAGCWAHARRKFVDSIPPGNKKCKAAHAVMLIDKMSALERKAREKKYTSEQLLEMRDKEVRPLIEEFYRFIGELRPSKRSHLGAAVTYAQNQKEKLLVFLEHPEVEMTNNLAERTVKPFVINRKNFLFSDTEKGADASAIFMSIIETAKRNNLDIYGYLLYLLTVLPEWGEDVTEAQIESVMPWSITLPKYCRQTYNEII